MSRDRRLTLRAGPARLVVDAPPGGAASGRALVLLGHGAGGGPQAVDLAAVTTGLVADGCTVLRFVQPYREAGRRTPPAASALDAAQHQLLRWLDTAAAGVLRRRGRPLVLGGRSSGARTACRTAATADACAVLALAFPLVPPWRTDTSRIAELASAVAGGHRRALVVQGERDPFGTPAMVLEQLAAAGANRQAVTVLPVAGAAHDLKPRGAGAAEAANGWVVAVRAFVSDVLAERE